MFLDANLNAARLKMLGEFAELALVLARDLQASALEAETPEEKTRLSEAFHKTGRGLRQTGPARPPGARNHPRRPRDRH